MKSSLRRRVTVTGTVVAIVISGWLAPTTAADPPFVGWSTLIPALTFRYEPTNSDVCVAGRTECVTKTIRQMQKRFDGLASSCSHQAVFALAYLRTTQAYLEYSTEPGFLADRTFVNHEDAAFAQMYLNAFDDWAAGRLDRVPPAWRIALGAAAGQQVNGLGNLLLGMNAHVNRDLPFVLATIGLTRPDGGSRKPDHDQINVVLNHVIGPLVDEAAARFDPQIPVLNTPFGVGYTAVLQTLVLWREQAWRFAEQLVSAPDRTARDAVSEQIETYAAATAKAVVAATAYRPPATTSSIRDQFCAAH